MGVEKVFRGEYETSEQKTFSWDDTVRGHVEIFTALLKGRGKGAGRA